MRQWTTALLNECLLDCRNREDILNKIKELAASYTPEWQFDTENADIGSCIALLYCDEMQELIKRYNMITERNCVELVDMLNISLKQAYPSQSVVLMDVIDSTIPGVKIPKGVKLLAEKEDDENIVFETANTVYLTNSRLKTVFMTAGKTGNVYPLKGEFEPLVYIDEKSVIKEPEEEDLQEDFQNLFLDFFMGVEEIVEKAVQKPKDVTFRLFDFQRENYGLHGLLLYHSHLFDVTDNNIVMELEDGEEIIEKISSGKFQMKYYTSEGFIPVDEIFVENEKRVIFSKSKQCSKVRYGTQEYSVILIEPCESISQNFLVSKIGFSSEGKPQLAQNVWDGNCELEADCFKPFGEVMNMYSELYIGHDEYFTKPGAFIRICFNLSFDKKLVSIPRQEEDASLKVIKRKPRKELYGAPAEVYADEIVLEYYNGTGWKRLQTSASVSQLFQNVKAGRCELEFECPKDWKETEAGSSQMHWLRFRLLRADNCYYQPALHNYPIIKDLTVEYSYARRFDAPQKVICFQGSRKRDMTAALAENPQIPIFFKNPYNTTSLYLGFDKKMEDGPISIMVDVEEVEGYSGRNIRYYYSTREGFSRLKLIDNTEGLAHTGTLVFIPPTDMAKIAIEGEEGYWIRITDEKQQIECEPKKSPLIKDIFINAVEVNNIDTLQEQDYYIDMFVPNMTFALNSDNILDVDVWVNEVNSFSESEIRSMLVSQSSTTRVEYNLQGGIEEFYVKWKEVDNFEQSKAGDRHYVVDRVNSTISFGDGVHVRIPKITKGIAFKITIRRCEGKAANVKAGAINSAMGNMMFVDTIANPKQAYGGMDMETLDEAIRRGVTLLGNKNRLISAMDYEREVLNFSNNINQVKVVVDACKDGTRRAGAVTIVLLMNDFKDGVQSFLSIKNRLRNHLLKKCELSVSEKELDIVQPLYVKVSVQVWVRMLEADDSFDVQQRLIKVLDMYLDPINNQFWDIGRMVTAKQIGMQLNIEKGNALIERVMLSALYEDENGIHEADLDSLLGNPYVLVMSGEHKIHFI